jgi:hypothetical protein
MIETSEARVDLGDDGVLSIPYVMSSEKRATDPT